MSKKNEINIEQELLATSYGQNRENNGVTDFSNGMLMNLTIEQVVTYDKNPRREINSEYEQIKESINRRGMDQVLSVTRRPTDPTNQFMIVHGGNTRLQILKELYEETKDIQFKNLQCRYVVWESESDALIGHLIENDARGDYSFIDRALGVLSAKQELEKETDIALSSRKLIKVLKEQGYKISRIDLYRMNYAVNVLYKEIPNVLDAGLGPSQVDSIQKLDKYALELFLELRDNTATVDDWKQLFKSILGKYNTKHWSYEDLYTDVLLVLADNNATEANQISFILSGRLEGLDKEKLKLPTANDSLNNELSSSSNDSTEKKSNSFEQYNLLEQNESENSTLTNSIENINQETNPSENENNNPDPSKKPIPENIATTEIPLTPSVEQLQEEVNVSPKNIRSKIFTIALQLASNNGFGELVSPLPSLGAGFVVKDMLSKSYLKGEQLFGNIKKRPYKERIMVWWMLLGFSELRIMSISNPQGISPLIPDGDLKRALFNQESSPQDRRRQALAHIFNRTGEFIIDDLSVYFWAVASEKNLAQVQGLQVLYRQLNEILDFNLWEMPS